MDKQKFVEDLNDEICNESGLFEFWYHSSGYSEGISLWVDGSQIYLWDSESCDSVDSIAELKIEIFKKMKLIKDAFTEIDILDTL